jgi:arylsulfatase A-like enzyme
MHYLPALLSSLFLGSAWVAHAAPKPNVVFIFTDDQRFDTVHALGNPVIKTPNLDRLARNGVSFRNAYYMGGTWGAVCMPSRNMLHTGRTLFHLAAPDEPSPATYRGNGIPPTHVMLSEQFRRHGYHTFMTGKWHQDDASFVRSFDAATKVYPGNGILEPVMNGPTGHYVIPLKEYDAAAKAPFTKLQITPGRHSTDIFGDAAVDYIRQRPTGDPFFLYLAFHAPHDPIMAPDEYQAMYPPEQIPLPASFAPDHPFQTGALRIRPFVMQREKTNPPYTAEAMRRITATYYAMITHLDAQVGRVLQALEETGRSQNTIIVFSSDNGFSLGDHGLIHKQSVYEQDVRVPLIMSGPGLPKNQTRAGLCYLSDVFPTLCDLVGLPTPSSVEGKSLLPVIRDATAAHRHELYFAYDSYQRGCRDDRYKLIEFVVPNKRANTQFERHTLLFDLHSDPLEQVNLADQPAQAGNLARMRALLSRLRDEYGDTNDRGSVFWKNHAAAGAP